MTRLISGLNAAAALAGTEPVWVEQSSLPVRTTVQDIADLGGGGSGMVTGISLNSGANINAANRAVLNFIEGSSKIDFVITDDAGGNEVDISLDVVQANIDHNLLLNFVGNKHIDWTVAGAENLATDRSANAVLALASGEVTQLANIGATVISVADWTAVAALVGVNTGDQTSIVGITGTKAQFDTAVTDGNISYTGHTHAAADVISGTFVAGRIPTHTGHVTGQTSLSLVVAAITGQTDIGANLVATDEIVVSDAGVIRRADISRFNNYFNANLNFNNYTHPAHPGDDFSVDSGPLTGANVISDIDINVTTDAEGHVTDANGVIATRAMSINDLGGPYLALAGGTVTGLATFSGGLNLSNANITGVGNIEIQDPGQNEGFSISGGNLWKIFESPNVFANAAGNFQFVQNTTRRMTINTSGQVEIPIATGTAPLVIASTTLVPNLNVSRLSGLIASDFIRSNVADNATGAITFSGANIQLGGSLRFNDNIELRLGTGNDAVMDFNGTDMITTMISGADWRLLMATENAIVATANGQVMLSYNGNDELQTQQHNAADNTTGAAVRHFDGTFYDVGMAVMPEVVFTSNTVISQTHWHKSLKHTGTGTLTLTYNTETNVDDGTVMWVKARDGDVTLIEK